MSKRHDRQISSKTSSGSDWPSAQAVVDALVVAICGIFVFSQLEPRWLLADTTTAGGDMGAHVWAPQYLKEHLLPHGRITGWTPDWYAGFPALTFYFPLPALVIALLSFVIPYDIAFKLVTVSGVVAMPVAAYVFGRCARLPFPAPACLAALTLPFLFDTGYTILGGNIASTLAGEFSFSIGLALSLVFLGLVAGGLDTGKRRWLAALFAGLVVLSHILPTIFALTGGVVLVVMRLVTGTPFDVPIVKYPLNGSVPKSPLLVRNGYVVGTLIVVIAFAVSWLFVGSRPSSGFSTFAMQFGLFVVGAVGAVVVARAARDTAPGEPRAGRSGVFRWVLPVGVFGGMLAGFWALPFVVRSPYMNDMGWEKIGTGVESGMKLYDKTITYYADALFPEKLKWLLGAALVSAIVAMFLRRRIGTFFVIIACLYAAGFVFAPQGRLWNARLLPFWYLSLYLLAGLLIAEVCWALTQTVIRWRQASPRTVADSATSQSVAEQIETDIPALENRGASAVQLVFPVVALLVSLAVVVPNLPPPSWWPRDGSSAPWHDPAKEGASFIPGWAAWNYSGYDGKTDGVYEKPAHPELQSLVDAMYDVGKTNGCGRAMWEYEPTLDRFGTPMALMLLPMWTNGCIGSMEGLFFESSATVPYHFLNQALLSQSPSSAMRNLPYGVLDVNEGVTRLQMMGVKYYMAVSLEAQQQAATDPRLSLVSSVSAAAGADGSERTWNVYQVAGSDLVAPLQNLPAVITDLDGVDPIVNVKRGGEAAATSTGADEHHDPSYREAWLENAVTWYQERSIHDVPLADDGPDDWPRVANASVVPRRVPAEPVQVSAISMGDDRISFHVDKVGVPVVVKMSYFPNWKATGANGPYRITPNLMVVVPTDRDVTLHYAHTTIDWLGMTMTVVGIVGIVWLWRRDREVDDAPVLATSSSGDIESLGEHFANPADPAGSNSKHRSPSVGAP